MTAIAIERAQFLEDRKAAGSCGLAGLELRRDLLGRAHLKGPELYFRDMRCGLELPVGEGRVRRARIQDHGKQRGGRDDLAQQLKPDALQASC